MNIVEVLKRLEWNFPTQVIDASSFGIARIVSFHKKMRERKRYESFNVCLILNQAVTTEPIPIDRL